MLDVRCLYSDRPRLDVVSWNVHKAEPGGTKRVHPDAEVNQARRVMLMSFHELKLSIEASFEAYREETSHRIRKLEETLQHVSSQQARHPTEGQLPKARVDHNNWASAKNAMSLKYSKTGASVPSYTPREFATSIFLH